LISGISSDSLILTALSVMMNDIDSILDDFVIQFKQRLLAESSVADVYFLDYAWKWFKVYKLPREKNTQFMYQNIISVHLSFLSGKLLKDIRRSDVQEAINYAVDRPRTCELIYLTLKQILEAAAADHLISQSVYSDSVRGVVLPKRIKKEKRPLTDIERKAVKTAVFSPMKNCFVKLLYYTGIRKGEALALTPEDFDFNDRVLRIRKTLIFIGSGRSEIKACPKSSNGFRDIPLPADLIESIFSYVSSCEGFLFHGSGQGVVLSNANFYRRFWDSILFGLNKAVGYDPFHDSEKPINGLTAHIFRHDYCTQLCYQVPKISTKMIARLLGDSEKMVLEVYSHIMLEKENVIDSIENAR